MRIALLLVLALPPAFAGNVEAQDWAGPASVGVEVVDESGRPIVGAAVVLIPEKATPDAAPPFVFTAADGTAEVQRLAEGEWQVEVRAAGYMIFNGYLKLAADGPPSVGFSSRQRTGTFWQPLEVRFFQPGTGDAPRVAASKQGREEEKRRRKEARQLRRQEEKAERRAAKREERRLRPSGGAEVAVLEEPPEEPAEAPEEPQEPTPQPPAPQPTPTPRPAGEEAPPSRPAAEPPPVRVAEAEPVPEPEPRPEAEPVPEPRPEPAAPRDLDAAPDVPPPAVPSIQERPVLFQGGACPECKPGEWALVVEQKTSPRRGETPEACGESRDQRVARLLRETLEPRADAVADYAGPVADAWRNRLPGAVWESVPAELRSAWESAPGACTDLVGVLPRGSRFIGFRYQAADAGGREGDCFGTDPCAIGEARFTSLPEIERTATVTVVHSSFFNASQSRERRATMTLYFRPPADWAPR